MSKKKENPEPSSSENASAQLADEAPASGWRKFLRRLKPGGDIHRDDLVEGLVDDDNLHADSFNENEKKFLKNILFLRSRHVEDVMVRRAQITALNVTATLEEMCDAFQKTGHSRLPLYRDTLDQPLGVLHIKDAFKLLAQNVQSVDLEKIMNPPLFVPPSMKVADLLSKMQEQRLHLALVIDEHGGTNGLVSIEDLVEEIVGEIEDEHAKDNPQERNFVRRRDGSFEVKADMSLEVLEEVLGTKIIDDARQTETIGGLTVALFGKVPEKGERVNVNNEFVIEVRSADLRRVQQLRIYPQ